MKFRTHYNYDPATMSDNEKNLLPSETDGSQNETLAQLIRRFTSQGIVIPPVEFQPEKPEELDAMLNGERYDVTESDDFDLADVSEALKEATEIVANLRNKQEQAVSTPTDKKTQDEPITGPNADAPKGAPQASGQ